MSGLVPLIDGLVKQCNGHTDGCFIKLSCRSPKDVSASGMVYILARIYLRIFGGVITLVSKSQSCEVPKFLKSADLHHFVISILNGNISHDRIIQVI